MTSFCEKYIYYIVFRNGDDHKPDEHLYISDDKNAINQKCKDLQDAYDRDYKDLVWHPHMIGYKDRENIMACFYEVESYKLGSGIKRL